MFVLDTLKHYFPVFGTPHLDERGRSPLHRAVRDGKVDRVHELVFNGANLDHEDKRGKTALSRAVKQGNIKVMRLLIDAGADLDLGEKNLIALAADKGHRKAVKLLLNKGAPLPSQVRLMDLWVEHKQKRNKKLAKLLAKQIADMQQAKQMLAHVDLGHRFHLHKKVDVGGSQDNPDREVSLEGAWPQRFLHEISATFGRWHGKQSPLSSEDLEEIQGVFQRASKYQPSAKDLLEQYSQGQPILISSGPRRHEVQLLFYGSYLIECDRINGPQPALRFNLIDPKRVSKKILKQLIKGTRRSAQFDDLLESTRKQLGAVRLDNFDYIEKLIPLSRQVVGNCTWTTSVAALLAMVLIKSLEKLDSLLVETFADGSEEQIRDAIYQSWKIVSKWQQREMAMVLERNLLRWKKQGSFPQPHFVNRLFQRVWTIKHPTKAFKKKIEQLEKLYLESLETKLEKDRFEMLKLCGPWVGVTPKRIML